MTTVMNLAPVTKEIDPNELAKVFKKPLIRRVDMIPDISSEISEVIVMSVDKFAGVHNWEAAAKLIKDTLDKKFGPAWHCCIGEGFGFDVTYQLKHLLYMFYGERLAILVYKC